MTSLHAITLLPPERPVARYPGLDVLRGVAALLVCLMHLEIIARGPGNERHVFSFGLLGVECFFTLSGFLIVMVAERTGSVLDFVAARAMRLYPVYLVSVVITAAYVLPIGKFGVGTVLLNATMLQNFVAVPNITNPYWTLALELSFYAGVTVLVGARLLARIEVLSLVWLGLALVYRLAWPDAMTSDPARPLAQLGFVLLAPQFAPFFVIGLMLYRQDRRKLGMTGGFALAAALGLTLFGRGDFAQIGGLAYGAAALLMTLALAVAARARRHGVLRPLARLGMISYPVYLLHCTIANIAVALAPCLQIGSTAAVLLSVPVFLALSALLHRRLERPAQLWCRQALIPWLQRWQTRSRGSALWSEPRATVRPKADKA